MAIKRKTVTLFIYLPKAKKVVLSRRARLERRAGLLQATVHGQIEPGEIPRMAMKREFEEEAKGDFHQLTNLRELGSAEVGVAFREMTFYHGAVIDDSLAKEFQLTPEVSEFVLISESNINKITPYSKVKSKLESPEGYDMIKNMVMYDDELKMLSRVFDEFRSV